MQAISLRAALRAIAHLVLLCTALIALVVSRPAEVGAQADTIVPFWLPYLNSDVLYTFTPRIAVDLSGGTHVIYKSLSADANKVYYAYCPSNCDHSASWGATIIGTLDTFGTDAQIALDPSGRPRVFWRRWDGSSNPVTFIYGACDTNCLTATSWTTATVASSDTYLGSEYGESRYFALDSQGQPRFIYNDTSPTSFFQNTYYRYCDTNCTNPANWSQVTIVADNTPATIYNDLALTFDSANRVRLAYYATSDTSPPEHIMYVECNTTCTTPTNWSTPAQLFPIVSTHSSNIPTGSAFSMRLDQNGHPRLIYYSGALGDGNPDNNRLFYAWCNAGCTTFATWSRAAVGAPQGNGDGPDLALDSSDHPHIVYANSETGTPRWGLEYAVCAANCETSTPSWTITPLEDPATIPPAINIPPCTQNAWYIGDNNVLALDKSGNPRVAYDAYNVQGFGCTGGERIRHVRFTTLLARNKHQYLPIVKK
jgi:hypothetical protein